MMIQIKKFLHFAAHLLINHIQRNTLQHQSFAFLLFLFLAETKKKKTEDVVHQYKAVRWTQYNMHTIFVSFVS